MSNFNKASKPAREWVESMGGLDNVSYRHGDDVSGLVQALEAAGLLAPDLPEPEDEWESEYPGVMHVRFGRAVSTCTPSRKPAVYLHGMVYETRIARQIALDILAACKYAEKEQNNESN